MRRKTEKRRVHHTRRRLAARAKDARSGPLSYFYTQWMGGDEVRVHAVSCSPRELREAWDYCNDIENDAPYLAFEGKPPDLHVDVWESYADRRLYPTASQARGAGQRAERKREQRARLQECARRSKKHRLLMRGGFYDSRHKAWRKRCGVAPGARYDKEAYYKGLWPDLYRKQPE